MATEVASYDDVYPIYCYLTPQNLVTATGQSI